MNSIPNPKASSNKKNRPLMKGNVIDFESVSLLSLKKYRSQFQIRIKPTVPKSELAAAIAEHFASIPVPEETEVIDQFFKALQKNRSAQNENEESADEPSITKKILPSDLKKKLKEPLEKDKVNSQQNTSDIHPDSSYSEISKNSTQSNSKKIVKRNSIPKVEKPQSQTAR